MLWLILLLFQLGVSCSTHFHIKLNDFLSVCRHNSRVIIDLLNVFLAPSAIAKCSRFWLDPQKEVLDLWEFNFWTLFSTHQVWHFYEYQIYAFWKTQKKSFPHLFQLQSTTVIIGRFLIVSQSNLYSGNIQRYLSRTAFDTTIRELERVIKSSKNQTWHELIVRVNHSNLHSSLILLERVYKSDTIAAVVVQSRAIIIGQWHTYKIGEVKWRERDNSENQINVISQNRRMHSSLI